MGQYKKKRISFVFLLIFIFLTACILTSGFLIYGNYKTKYKMEIEHQLVSIAELKVNQLVQWRKERLGDADIFYENTAFSSLAKRYFANPNDFNAKTRIQTWMEQVASAYQYNRICLHDTNGLEYLSSPQNIVHPPYIFWLRAKEALASGKIVFQDFYRDENDQQVYLTIFIPLIDASDKNHILGILAMRIDPAAYLYEIIQDWPIPSKTSETLIIRRDGNDAVYLNELRFLKDAALNLRIPLQGPNTVSTRAALGQEGIVEAKDYRREHVIAYVHSIPDSPWFLVAKTNTEEAFAPLKERFWLMIVLMGALLVGTGASLGFIWRQQENRLYREQYQSAEALRESERKFRETVINLDEGYYSVTLDGILLEHNQAFNRIMGFDKSEDLKGSQLPDFWENPDERMAYLQELSVKGSVSNYQINAKTKAGNQITVIASAHLVKDADKRPLRIEGVFLDITERMKAESLLRESESRLRSTMDNMLEGSQILDYDWRYIYLNKSAESHSRLPAKELLGKRFMDMWPGIEKTELFKTIKHCMEERKPSHFDNEFTFPDGETGWFELSIQPIPEGVFILSIDITERIRTEQELRENARKLQEAQEMAHLGFWSWDVKTGDVEWSEEVYKIFCLDPETFTPQIDSILALSPWPEDHERDKDLINRAIESHSPGDYEQKFLRPDQSVGYYYSTFQGNYDENGELVSIVGTVLDITERKRAEEEIIKSEARLKEAQRIGHIGSWELDLATNTLIWSDEIYKMFEIDSQKFSASYEAFLNTIHPDDREEVDKAYTNSHKTKKPYRIEHRLLLADGRIKYVREECETFYNADGTPLRSVGIVQDITERKLAEEELRALSSRQEAILAAVPDILMEVDTQKTYTWANRAGFNFFGENVIGKNADFYFEGEQATYDSVRPLFDGDENVVYVESWQRRADGNKRLLAWWCRVLKDEYGNVTGALSSARDITEHKQAQEMLLESENKFRNVFDNSAIGKSITSLDGTVHVNQAFCDMLGYENKEMLQQRWQDISHPDDLKMTQQQLDELLSGKAKFVRLIKRYIKKNGGTIWAEVNTVLQRDINGEPQYYITSAVDITKRKQAEDEIRKLNAGLEQRVRERTVQLEAANRELEAFSYSVSHDLRAPLRHISGYVDLVINHNRPVLSEKGQHYLDSIADSVHEMGLLIDHLLQFSRTGRTEMHRSPQDMNVLVKEVKESLCHDYPERSIKWNIEILPVVNCDSMMLHLVWMNLLGNAVKFTRNKKKARIEIGSRKEDGEIVFFVRDNGVGFDMKYAKKLFGVFQRLHPADEFEGTGIGLANVYRIISRHGGRTWAEAEPGKGAAFYFTLPL